MPRGADAPFSRLERSPFVITRDFSNVAIYYANRWLREQRRLQVSWATRFSDGEAHSGNRESNGEAPPPGIHGGIAYGVEVGETHLFDAGGRMVERRSVPPKRFRKIVFQ